MRMRPFQELVGEVRAEVKSAVSPPETAAYVGDPGRCAEAYVVDPCIRRFVAVEIDPASEKGVGRYGPQRTLGRLLRKDLAGLDETSRTQLCDAVGRALAMGYLRMVVAEPGTNIEFRADRSAEDIWQWWVTSFNEQDGVIKQLGYGGLARIVQ